jgi:hypothetical protein
VDLPISHDLLYAELDAARAELERLLRVVQSPALCSAENNEEIDIDTLTGKKTVDGAVFLRRFRAEIGLVGQKLNVLAMTLDSDLP